jgi:hypothetical protein
MSDSPWARTPRHAAGSVSELLAGASGRQPFASADGKSGALFERVTLDGAPYVVKYLRAGGDWIMRGMGDTAGWPAVAFTSGLLDLLPASIDHAIAGVATGIDADGTGAALLMHDRGPLLVPPGDDPIGVEQHDRFIDHLAELSACFDGWTDDVGLAPHPVRWLVYSDDMLAGEAARGWPNPVPMIVAEGWARFAEIAPADVRDAVAALRADLTPFTTAVRATPPTLLHGDWKLGNLGSHPDGRTVLLDWAGVGEGPACHDLAWYLALNRARLPVPKETVIAAFRARLEAHGLDTAPWFERQLGLCLLGAMVQYGWEKALGDPGELGWWCDRAREGARLL